MGMMTHAQCLLTKTDFGMNLMRKAAVSHLSDLKKFCRGSFA